MRPNNRRPAALGGALSIGFVLPVCLAVALVPADISRMHTVSSTLKAIDLFKRAGFDPRASGPGSIGSIPRLFLASLPGDMPDLQDAGTRKAVFVSIVLPHVLHENERLLADRKRLLRLQVALSANRHVSRRDRRWLEGQAGRYGTAPEPAALLAHVDIVPPRLAVAQAAQESGWGTSRFAQAGNALFGQHAPPGIDAIAAEKASGVSLRAFADLRGSVRGYMHNLNTHRAYRGFRRLRAQMRARGDGIDGHALAGTLGAYSEERGVYIERLRRIMTTPEVAMTREAALIR